MNRQIISIILSLVFLGGASDLFAQGTAFNYQGQLNEAGAPANGSYDMHFAVYDAVTNGNRSSVWLTNSAVAVSNGLFTTTLDFGDGIFSGTNYWLDIAVRKSGGASFTTLYPRQPILPVPYAIFANSSSNVLGTVSATQLTGTVPSSQISGTYGNAVNFANGSNTFAGTFSGTFSGDGAALNSLNGSQVTSGTIADARLSANVALLDHSQTFTGNNQFSGANSFTNWANSFTGNFFGNGLVGWITVSGTTQQAERDHGYMLTSAGLTTVTLPVNTGLTNGDIVRVSGAGGGGWQVKENTGQVIFGNLSSFQNSYSVSSSTGDYYGVAASADGTTMYAVGNGFNGVSYSTDSGHTWSPVAGILSGSYYSVACSANGKTVYAETTAGGTIKVSTNGGLTWANSSYSSTPATQISCTADGSKVFTGGIACSGNGTYLGGLSSGSIYVSTNAGANWFTIVGPPGTPVCLGVSSGCNRLVAGVNNGLLYTSSNRGTNWTAVTTTSQKWSGAWMSPDGTRFAGTVSGTFPDGGVYSYGVSVLPNTISTNSVISGSQGSSVELQYIGNGQFMPVSSSGTIWAN